jgi:hypothetical protein
MMIIMQSVGNKDEKILSLINFYGVVVSLSRKPFRRSYFRVGRMLSVEEDVWRFYRKF